MLENFQTNDYSFESLSQLNDNLQYLDHIDRNYEFKTVTVSPDTAYRYQGNFFGLLSTMNIDPGLYLYTMYINGYKNPRDYAGDKFELKLAIKPPIPVS